MNRILQSQSRHNQQSRGTWQCAREHRERVTTLLLNSAPGRSRLCLLGAGNCNDVDLCRLLEGFGHITLIDIDRQAMEQGLAKQLDQAADQTFSRIEIIDADVTGISEALSLVTDSATDIELLVGEICSRLQQIPTSLPIRSFDVVASVCLLSQIVFEVNESLGQDASLLRVIQAVRQQHLHLLVQMLRLGGRGFLITDFVSSVTAPELTQVPANALSEVVRALIHQQNFFTGLNPAVLANQMQTDPTFSGATQRLQVIDPWIWDFGPRVYAVCGFQFDVRSDEPSDARLPLPTQSPHDV